MFDLATFKQAVAQRNRDWATTHKILYRLCSEMPQHSDLGETRAKLLIIGRSFATGIERAIHSKGGQGSAIEQLADYVCRNAGQIDKQFARLRGLDGSCPEHLREAVDVHGKLMEVLKKGKRGKKGICRPNRSPRSFVSKYLHFHFPFVPIYDNYSRRGLNREVHWTEEVNALFLAAR